jgi:hypothetical protein
MARKKDNSIWNGIIIGIAILLAAGLLIYFFQFNVFTQQYFSPISGNFNQHLDNVLNDPSQITGQCSLSISPSIACLGDTIAGTVYGKPNTRCYIFVTDGTEWKMVYDGRTNENGVLYNADTIHLLGRFQAIAFCDNDDSGSYTSGDCFTNIQDLLIKDCSPTPPPSWNVGDVVGGGSGSGTISGGAGLTQYFDLSDIPATTGGNCYLGAKLSVTWDYKNVQNCYYMQGLKNGVYISFLDSSGVVWDYPTDVPGTYNKNFCPLSWDGVTPWKLMINMWDPELTPGCEIDYSYNLIIDVCHCDD